MKCLYTPANIHSIQLRRKANPVYAEMLSTHWLKFQYVTTGRKELKYTTKCWVLRKENILLNHYIFIGHLRVTINMSVHSSSKIKYPIMHHNLLLQWKKFTIIIYNSSFIAQVTSMDTAQIHLVSLLNFTSNHHFTPKPNTVCHHFFKLIFSGCHHLIIFILKLSIVTVILVTSTTTPPR